MRIALGVAVFMLAVFTAQRFALLIGNWSGLPHSWNSILSTLQTGFHMDLAVVSVLTLPWLVFLSLPVKSHGRSVGLTIALFVWMFGFVFLNICDAFFFEEFNSRFNYIAIDYLFLNTAEVLNNIYQSYPVVPILLGVGVAIGGALWLIRRKIQPTASTMPSVKKRLAWLLAGGMVNLFLVSGVDIRTVNANPNRMLGEIGANGFYTLFYALKTNHLVYDRYYLTMPDQEAFERSKRLVYQPGDQAFGSHGNPLLRHVSPRNGLGRKNVIVVLEESFGSAFVGTLRHPHEAVTPAFDRISQRGLLFTRIYATGTRTVRGLEAVLASFPPIPGASIIKREGFGHVSTLAGTLKGRGYNTTFIYGGRGLFDNMKEFMVANGFDRFVEQKDYSHPAFTTAWGVSDEDIFNKVLEESDGLSAQGKPFFLTVLTVSNHKPYTYPKGRIDLDPDRRRRPHAVKYADWALGNFLEQAKSHPFFKDTVFVVLGDHGARVYGADFIPLPSYEIPLLIYAPHLLPKPQRIDVLGSSMDVAPTILGLLGLGYDSTFFGRDLLHSNTRPAFALLQHDRDIARLQGDRLILLSTGDQLHAFRHEPDTSSFTRMPLAAKEDGARDTIALYQTAYRLFERGLYRTPDQKGTIR